MCDHLARDRGRTAGATPAIGRRPPPTRIAFPQGTMIGIDETLNKLGCSQAEPAWPGQAASIWGDKAITEKI